jgi:hypothetical protein
MGSPFSRGGIHVKILTPCLKEWLNGGASQHPGYMLIWG